MFSASTRLLAATLLAFASPTLAGVSPIAPPFQFDDLAGQPLSLAMLRGRVVVLSYWATWCAPCKAELAMLDRLHRTRRADGLQVIAVTNERGVSTARLRNWTTGLALPIVLAENAQDRGYGPIGGILPTIYVIDRAGLIRLRRSGAMPEAELARMLAGLLAEPAPRRQ